MTHEEMKQEKLAMQKALIYFEGRHGRPVSFICCSRLFSICQSDAAVFDTSVVSQCLKSEN